MSRCVRVEPPAACDFDIAIDYIPQQQPETHPMRELKVLQAQRSQKRSSRKSAAILPAAMPLSGANGITAVSYSGMSRKVLLHYHEAGQLPLKKIGRRWFVRKDDLDALIALIFTIE